MILRQIRATEVRVPFRSGWTDSPEYGTSSWKDQTKWILEIETADGLTGIGETPRGVSRASIEWISRSLAGRSLDTLNLTQLALPVGGEGYLLAPADSRERGDDWEYSLPDRVPFFGFEIALWDLLGKRAQLPLFTLFGGAWRQSIPMGFWIGRMTPADAARQMEIGLEMGFRSLKMKAFPQDDIAEVVGAIRKTAGFDLPITIDPNRKFQRLSETLRIDRSLQNFAEITYEDPFPYHAIEWRELRRVTGRSLIWHATKSSLRADPIQAAIDGSCDGVNISPFSAKEILNHAENAAVNRILHWQGSGLDLGIFDAFLLHTSAASQTAALPGDAIGHLLRENDLIEESLVPIDSAIPVPRMPGLGVTLDTGALAHYQVNSLHFPEK